MSRRKRGAQAAGAAGGQQQPARKAVPDAFRAKAETAQLPVYDPDSKFSVKEYIILNVIFDAFCVLNLGLVHYFLNETRGLYFFFGLLMLGFMAVSVYDYAFDRLATRADEPPAS